MKVPPDDHFRFGVLRAYARHDLAAALRINVIDHYAGISRLT